MISPPNRKTIPWDLESRKEVSAQAEVWVGVQKKGQNEKQFYETFKQGNDWHKE